MTYLLDTHSFLWSAFSPGKLSETARSTISDSTNSVAVSSITFWEISLKYALGKIELKGVTPDDLPHTAHEMGYDLARLGPSEAASFHRLPLGRHKDPFDRMLAWQAINRRWTLVSRDSELSEYKAQGLKVLW